MLSPLCSSVLPATSPSTFPQLVFALKFCDVHIHLVSISISLSCGHFLPKARPFIPAVSQYSAVEHYTFYMPCPVLPCFPCNFLCFPVLIKFLTAFTAFLFSIKITFLSYYCFFMHFEPKPCNQPAYSVLPRPLTPGFLSTDVSTQLIHPCLFVFPSSLISRLPF